jgi:hypothetical protein
MNYDVNLKSIKGVPISLLKNNIFAMPYKRFDFQNMLQPGFFFPIAVKWVKTM